MTTSTAPSSPSKARRGVVRTLHHDPGDRPHVVVWEVTRACQLACRHCRADAFTKADPRQLTTAEGKALLEDLAGYGTPHPIVVLSGGDAFERSDLEELIAHGSSLGLPMALSPSVTPLLTDERLGSVREAGVKAFSISLDGATAQTHDSFRGIDGTFADSLSAAELVLKHGFRFQVNTTVCRNNVHELPQILRTVLGMGAGMWYLLFLVPMGRGSNLEPLDAEEMEDVLHWIHDVSDRIAVKVTEGPSYRRVALQRDDARAAGLPLPPTGELHAQLRAQTAALLGEAGERRPPRPPIGVNSARGFAFVDHVGDVYPSGFLPYQCGSVREQPFSAIYAESPMMQALRDPSTYSGKCGVCEFNWICGGSRARAHAMLGDPLASDPTCSWQPTALAAAD
ncbi:TIGR04053 family radical SAM/SPASM domain-containing protein [Tessaracoccus rhinocerotis]|uniref:TIGR04053 family radical SAM/SPASM domain-containing protein n=1 Tax=Tessaracoccus rhinocerotis TaxID=1689449 RepID=A0A553K441_9ACTN|nr:TIGR04053 family radical SAM/SPASM domain-containing protein [Tessaracoccus rhinocerotis]TRY19480.1 TIGR04053 family radical SAM/SPASM domain-containing protein [Tessaracoccus rhinocerotis]